MLFGARQQCMHRLHKSRHELIDFARAGVAIIWQTKNAARLFWKKVSNALETEF